MARFLIFTLPLKFALDEGRVDDVRRAADVERTHRELRAGLTDGLGGDDADRLTDVDRRTARQIAAVALAAHARDGLAGQHRADADFLDLRLLDGFGVTLLDQVARLDDERAFAVLGGGARRPLPRYGRARARRATRSPDRRRRRPAP